MNNTLDQRITHLQFIQRENSVKHHSYSEETLSYEYIRQGDMKAVTEGVRIFHSDNVGHLSDMPLRNKQYLFVAATTLAARYAIEGGIAAEDAYIASDLFIQRADKAGSVSEINDLHKEMLTYYVKQVAAHRRTAVTSKPVIQCMDYIYYHLHENVNGTILAEITGLNRSYLSTLFHKETGMTISDYIMSKKMEATENMLKYSDYTLTEISEFLNFSSYSYLAKVFRELHGMSPREYRMRYFGHSDIGTGDLLESR